MNRTTRIGTVLIVFAALVTAGAVALQPAHAGTDPDPVITFTPSPTPDRTYRQAPTGTPGPVVTDPGTHGPAPSSSPTRWADIRGGGSRVCA